MTANKLLNEKLIEKYQAYVEYVNKIQPNLETRDIYLIASNLLDADIQMKKASDESWHRILKD